jgi:hypothetical protein
MRQLLSSRQDISEMNDCHMRSACLIPSKPSRQARIHGICSRVKETVKRLAASMEIPGAFISDALNVLRPHIIFLFTSTRAF